LLGFDHLGYRHDPALSRREPCFVCTDFAGKGLSVRGLGRFHRDTASGRNDPRHDKDAACIWSGPSPSVT
jgi:hypothetical protein